MHWNENDDCFFLFFFQTLSGCLIMLLQLQIHFSSLLSAACNGTVMVTPKKQNRGSLYMWQFSIRGSWFKRSFAYTIKICSCLSSWVSSLFWPCPTQAFCTDAAGGKLGEAACGSGKAYFLVGRVPDLSAEVEPLRPLSRSVLCLMWRVGKWWRGHKF